MLTTKKAKGIEAAAKVAGVQAGVLGDADIAQNLVTQAEQMKAQGKMQVEYVPK